MKCIIKGEIVKNYFITDEFNLKICKLDFGYIYIINRIFESEQSIKGLFESLEIAEAEAIKELKENGVVLNE